MTISAQDIVRRVEGLFTLADQLQERHHWKVRYWSGLRTGPFEGRNGVITTPRP